MEKVIEIINKIESHDLPCKYVSDGHMDSWGVGFTLTNNIDPNIFDFNKLLKISINDIKENLSNLSEDTPRPQLIIDYKREEWVITFEVYPDSNLDYRYNIVVFVDEGTVKTLLTTLIESEVELYDVMSQRI